MLLPAVALPVDAADPPDGLVWAQAKVAATIPTLARAAARANA
jgi:hypothetical protein